MASDPMSSVPRGLGRIMGMSTDGRLTYQETINVVTSNFKLVDTPTGRPIVKNCRDKGTCDPRDLPLKEITQNTYKLHQWVEIIPSTPNNFDKEKIAEAFTYLIAFSQDFFNDFPQE